MRIPVLALIFQGVPEQVAITALACVLVKAKLHWKKIVPLSVILVGINYFLRLLPIAFGIHTLALIVLLIIFMILWLKIDLLRAIIGSLVSYLTLIIVETACLAVIVPMFKITPEVLGTNWVVRTLVGIPQLILLSLITFLIHKLRVKKGIT